MVIVLCIIKLCYTRLMNLHILAIGKKKTDYDAMIAEYVQRITKPWTATFEILAPAGYDHRDQSRNDESNRLTERIKSDDVVIVLDEHGKDITTIDFAKKLDAWMNQGIKRVVIVIGGSYGLEKTVSKQAQLVMRFGAMTLPHEMVRLIITEQLYRTTNWLSGGKYHHE